MLKCLVHQQQRKNLMKYFRTFSTTEQGNLERVCIVGSGPAGFYTAKYLLKEHPSVHIDMIEALPTPFGLVRYGVAPDHPEVKSVIHDFEKVAENQRFQFVGNMKVGEDVSVDFLRPFYNAIVFCYGAGSDRKLNIPGEELQNIFAARSFVNWYNGHPSFRNLNPALSGDTAVVIGQGNVAIDCARILSKDPAELALTDISDHALQALSLKGIKRVVVIGRRGCVQASFTIKEIRELTRLKNCKFTISKRELQDSLTESSKEEIKSQRAKKRIYDLLEKSVTACDTSACDNEIELRFLHSPIEFLPDPEQPDRVGMIRVEKMKLVGQPGKQQAVGSGEYTEIKCGLVLRSIGYKSEPIESVPFDQNRYVLPNQKGQIPSSTPKLSGLFCSGWVKRGPTGIIGTNITDARETVASILNSSSDNILPKIENKGGILGVVDNLKQSSKGFKEFLSWGDYKEIDSHEIREGKIKGKPREKITSVQGMINVLDK